MKENILVFKTNIRYKKDLQKVRPHLQSEPRISRWNVDREDISRVLRIQGSELGPHEVISLVNKAGFDCEELND